MIVIGYQGIGKTTLCNNPNLSLKFVDLESSSFRDDKGDRPSDWYIYYCNIAEHLSQQNCIVFISSHKEVRERLRTSKEDVVVCCPSPELKDKWIEKLESRYNKSKSDKDYRAWRNAVDRYTDNINELKNSGFPVIEINNPAYDLKQLIIDYEMKLLTGCIVNSGK